MGWVYDQKKLELDPAPPQGKLNKIIPKQNWGFQRDRGVIDEEGSQQKRQKLV